MTKMHEIRSLLAAPLEMLNEHISASLTSSNELVNKIVIDYLKSKGKQIRPILVMLSARAFTGGPLSREVISAASSVEMLHNATLIHDDVVDRSDRRRGCPTINSVWDNHIAVLIGDFFVSSSLQEALASKDLRVVSEIASLGKELSVGEMDQICNARFHVLSEDAYFQVIGRKTASLFVACIDMGAYSTGVSSDDERLKALREFARLLGLCFQIKDDIFDYYDDRRPGKPTGNDLREGKVTLPLLHCLLDESNPEHEKMNEIVKREELTDTEIGVLYDYARRSGGVDYSYAKMAEMRDTAVGALRGAFAEAENVEPLIDIFDYIITRDF